jgi:hypothetical protein
MSISSRMMASISGRDSKGRGKRRLTSWRVVREEGESRAVREGEAWMQSSSAVWLIWVGRQLRCWSI